ncbi:MAG: hypothetical protein ABEJ72_02010, partial [Candidatus Aenigmatarchaeota archaeon]
TTKFAPPEWYQFCRENEALLSLEELDRGSKGVRQAVFELVGSRKLFGKELHPDTKIAGAINGGVHSHMYQVAELDLAQSNRWHMFDCYADPDVWLDWASDQKDVPTTLVDFISENPDQLMEDGEIAEGDPHKTPRMWHRIGQAVLKYREETGVDLFDEKNHTQLRNMAVGSVGYTAAQRLESWLQDYEREMTAEELVAGEWEEEDFSDWNEVDHSNMISKLDHSGLFDTFLKEEEFEEPYKNLAWYALQLDAENILQFIQAMVLSDVPEANAAYWQCYEFDEGRHKGKEVREILQPRLAENIEGEEDVAHLSPDNEDEEGSDE